MMQTISPRSWKEDFERAASNEREDILYREKMKRFEAREYERRAELHLEEVRQEERAFSAFGAAFAPPEAIIEFRRQLDDYDTKMVEALMEKQELLDQQRKVIEKMEAEAYRLPDGRMVFKRADNRVVDEHGNELSPEVVNPENIDDKRTKWEPFKAAKDKETQLTAERNQLLDYQSKLDAARERLDKGEITNAELQSLKRDLAEDMPAAVREKLGLEKPQNAALQDAKATPQAAAPDDLGAFLQQNWQPAAPGR